MSIVEFDVDQSIPMTTSQHESVSMRDTYLGVGESSVSSQSSYQPTIQEITMMNQ